MITTTTFNGIIILTPDVYMFLGKIGYSQVFFLDKSCMCIHAYNDFNGMPHIQQRVAFICRKYLFCFDMVS